LLVTNNDALKRAAALEAARLIEDGMVVGLGTGSTVRHLLDALAERRARGELGDVVGVPTSEDTKRRSDALGIPLGDLNSHPRIDLTIDGTDEFDPELNLIKGLGGALLREKLVALASSRFVVMADESKRVGRLGEKAPLPVEVDPFALTVLTDQLRALGSDPRLRRLADNTPYRTDGGNVIVDCFFDGGIPDPDAVARELDLRSGIFEHGLFLGMADRVIVSSAGGVEIVGQVAKGRGHGS
jgi:ribose 5-phosphate isomerase A